MEVIDYMTRHITLVLDTDQGTYNAVMSAVRKVFRYDFGTVTVGEYRQMDDAKRRELFAQSIGEAVLDLFHELVAEVTDQHHGHTGQLLITEILPSQGDYDLEWRLGQHYMPETNDAADFMTDDE